MGNPDRIPSAYGTCRQLYQPSLSIFYLISKCLHLVTRTAAPSGVCFYSGEPFVAPTDSAY
eukprot:6204336-Pleurochrysis_carterae.AAC.2